MNDVALKVEDTDIEFRPQQQEMDIYKPSQALSPERFAFLWEVTVRIAGSQMVPESLRTKGPANNKVALSVEEIQANVFFVVEIADRWGISPFALLPCASMVHGRLGFEGKVIDAVLEGVYGIKLKYDWSGEGENMAIVVSGADRHGEIKEIEGTVKEWKTTHSGTPWRPATYKKMLAYRGAREWARLHKSVAMLASFQMTSCTKQRWSAAPTPPRTSVAQNWTASELRPAAPTPATSSGSFPMPAVRRCVSTPIRSAFALRSRRIDSLMMGPTVSMGTSHPGRRPLPPSQRVKAKQA